MQPWEPFAWRFFLGWGLQVRERVGGEKKLTVFFLEPENQKVLVNAPFMQMLIDELFQENPDNFDILPRLLITFGKFSKFDTFYLLEC